MGHGRDSYHPTPRHVMDEYMGTNLIVQSNRVDCMSTTGLHDVKNAFETDLHRIQVTKT